MSSVPIDLLYLMAEVSIATVALSGITMVLATSRSSLTAAQASEIAVQLRMASIVTTFCIFPLIVLYWGLDDTKLWRVSSSFYLAAVVGNFIWNALHPVPRSSFFGKLVLGIGFAAIALLGMNLWLGQAWPHITQLFLGWLGSLTLFLGFMHQVLTYKVEKRDAG